MDNFTKTPTHLHFDFRQQEMFPVPLEDVNSSLEATGDQSRYQGADVCEYI